MKKEHTFLLVILGFLAFAFTVPIVPLLHSCPANGCDISDALAYHGSLSWAMFQIGVVVDGIGKVGFGYVGSNLILLVFIGIPLVMWVMRKHIVRKEVNPLQRAGKPDM